MIDIGVRFVLMGGGSGGLHNLNSGLRETQRETERTESSLEKLSRRVVEMFGAYEMFHLGKSLMSTLIGSSSEMEQLRLGVAGVLNATQAGKFADSVTIARDRIKELTEYAKTHVGTAEDYYRVFQGVLSVVRSSGGSSLQAADLTKKFVPIAMAMQGPEGVNLLGYQLREVIQMGMFGREAPMLQNALRAVGLSRQQFNMLGTTGRIEALLKGAEKFGPMLAAGEKTLNAQTTTLHSNLLQLGRIGIAPVFEGEKQALAEINDWIERNRSGLEQTAVLIGGSLTDGMRNLAAMAKSIGSHTDLLKILAGVGGAVIAFKSVSAVGSFAMGQLGAGAAGVAAAQGTGIFAAMGSLAMFAGRVGMAAGALYGLYEVGNALAKTWVDERIRAKDADEQQRAVNRVMATYQTRLAMAVNQEALTPAQAGARFVETKGAFLGGAFRAAAAAGALAAGSSLAKLYGLDTPEAQRLLHPGPKEKLAHTVIMMNVVVKQDFRDVQDPDRIAELTVGKLNKLARAATQSRRALPYGR